MPQGLREIRRRIRSVQNTQKITQAMKLVAAAKLRRAQERAHASRPYAERIEDVLRAVARSSSGSAGHPLLVSREVKTVGYVLLTSDRGLCGPYNASLLRQLESDMQPDVGHAFFVVGRKGRDYLRRRHRNIVEEYIGIGDEPRYYQSLAIGEAAAKAFVDGTVDEVRLVYPQFISAMSQRATVQRVLPLQTPKAEEGQAQGPRAQYSFEPDVESVLSQLVPQYLYAIVYRAMLEAKASEHGARMTAMDSATKNSSELIKNLVLQSNRLRQAAITQEIAEIVGGAAAFE